MEIQKAYADATLMLSFGASTLVLGETTHLRLVGAIFCIWGLVKYYQAKNTGMQKF